MPKNIEHPEALYPSHPHEVQTYTHAQIKSNHQHQKASPRQGGEKKRKEIPHSIQLTLNLLTDNF